MYKKTTFTQLLKRDNMLRGQCLVCQKTNKSLLTKYIKILLFRLNFNTENFSDVFNV